MCPKPRTRTFFFLQQAHIKVSNALYTYFISHTILTKAKKTNAPLNLVLVPNHLGHLALTDARFACAVCPLNFSQPTDVIKACRNIAAPSPSCCSSLNTYIAGIQKQMLITNKQAIMCATMFGSMLRRGGVMTNIYELCDVDLKDFSLQGKPTLLVLTFMLQIFCC